MFSKRTRNALKLLYQLNRRPDPSYATVEELSEQTGIPRPYLGKIVGVLAKFGYLETKKGPAGGVRLGADPGDIMIEELLSDLEEFSEEEIELRSNGSTPTAVAFDHTFLRFCVEGFKENVLGSMTLEQANELVENPV